MAVARLRYAVEQTKRRRVTDVEPSLPQITHTENMKAWRGRQEDRCLFTGDGGDYYLVFLGHAEGTGVANGLDKPKAREQTPSSVVGISGISVEDSYFQEQAPHGNTGAANTGKQFHAECVFDAPYTLDCPCGNENRAMF